MLKKRFCPRTTFHLIEDKAFTILLVLIASLGSFCFFTGYAPATGLCSNPIGGQCYAERTWYGHTGGSNVLINPFGNLTCYGCSGFIDDETWFSDTSSAQCLAVGACWVEAGISTWPANDPNSCNQGHDSTCGFWADNRPNGGGYHEHPLYNFGADGANIVPYLFYITIVNNNGFSSSGSTWDVTTNIYYNGNWIAGPTGVSASNNMNVNSITIGSELSDSKGSAGSIYFQYNQWMDGSGVFHYQTNGGTNTGTGAPPQGSWAVTPCNCSGNTGGSFETWD